MSLRNKAKEALVEYAVLTSLGGITLLFLVLWQAVPSSFWQMLSDSVPKNVLWAIVGILTTTLITLSIYCVQLYLKTKTKLIHFSGVLWDIDHNLYCPKDESPLFQSGRTGYNLGQGVEVFTCSKCDREISFNDEDGALIRFKNAQEKFIEKMQILPGKNFKELKPPSIEDYFDDKTIEILNEFGKTVKQLGADELVTRLRWQPAIISHHIDILIHKNFIKKGNRTYTESGNSLYELTEVGRAYIAKNDLL